MCLYSSCINWNYRTFIVICKLCTNIFCVKVQAVVFGPVEVEEKINEFSGLHGNSDTPVGICQTRTLPPALFLDDALAALQAAIVDLEQNPIALKSGILRFEVPMLPKSPNSFSYMLRDPSLQASQRSIP